MKKTMELLTVLTALMAVTVSAAKIEGVFSGNAAATDTYDFVTLGALDWVYWDETGSPLSGVPENEKSGGSLIGDAYGVGTSSTLRGASSRASEPTMSFAFDDGVSPSSGIVTNPMGRFNVTHNLISNGVGVVVDLPTTNTYQVTVYVSGFGAFAGRLTASLSGTDDYVNTNYLAVSGGDNDSSFYTLYVTPDTAGDDLTIEFVQETETASYDFAVLNGVAVCLAPPVSLEGSFSGNASATGTYNLTALGKEDWVFWHTGSYGGTPSNSRSGGNLIRIKCYGKTSRHRSPLSNCEIKRAITPPYSFTHVAVDVSLSSVCSFA